jgi:putative FmdB family regulatory protein
MPLYEYECDACHHRFEVIQKFSDPPVTTCPKCGGPVHKLVASPAFQFKGTGWYITDYAKKKEPGGHEKNTSETSADKTAKSEKSEKSDKTATSTTKSESPPPASSPASAPTKE